MEKKDYKQPEIKLHQFKVRLLDAISEGAPNQDSAAKQGFLETEEYEE